jgi:hypothetical protein
MTFDNRHEYGVLPASHHGLAPAQIAAIKAKTGGGGISKVPKVKASGGGHAPSGGHSPHLPGGHKGGGEHKEKSEFTPLKHLAVIGKGIKEAAKATAETVVAASGTEPVAAAVKPGKHHMGFSEAGKTHHFGHAFSYGGSDAAGGGIGAGA